MEVIIGAIASLIASLVWYCLTVLYNTNSRKKIDYMLEMACDCTRLFEYSIQYNDYDVAMTQTDRLLDLFMDIDDNIKTLTYFPKKKKLILTYIYNAMYIISIFKNMTVGYSGEQEKRARCESFKRKYLYEVEVGDDDDYSVSFLSLSISLVQELNRNYSVSKVLKTFYSIESRDEKRKSTYLTMVASNSFNYKNAIPHFMKNLIFTKDEYTSYMKKKLK